MFAEGGNDSMLRKFAWGTCGGALTGVQNFLKDALTITKAKREYHGHDPNFHYPWYFSFFCVLAGATAFIGLLLLTACMKRYDAAYSSATFVGSFVVSASIMSAVHYKTFEMLQDMWNYILYPLGLVILMIGVYILVHEKHHNPDDDDDNDDDNGPRRRHGSTEDSGEPAREIGKDSEPSEVCNIMSLSE